MAETQGSSRDQQDSGQQHARAKVVDPTTGEILDREPIEIGEAALLEMSREQFTHLVEIEKQLTEIKARHKAAKETWMTTAHKLNTFRRGMPYQPPLWTNTTTEDSEQDDDTIDGEVLLLAEVASS